jgi:hypothetical protein
VEEATEGQEVGELEDGAFSTFCVRMYFGIFSRAEMDSRGEVDEQDARCVCLSIMRVEGANYSGPQTCRFQRAGDGQ